MKELFHTLREILENGENAMLVTITASSGSTPRGAGARMLVGKGGIICGTIGGGAVEHRAAMSAVNALNDGRSLIKSYALHPGDAADLGMVCGGDMEVFFQHISPKDLGLVEYIIECFDGGEDCWLIIGLTGTSGWSMGTYASGSGLYGIDIADEAVPLLLKGVAVRLEYGGRWYFSEPLVRAGKVIVFGGGHVARELIPVLSRVGFRCVVFDDREEFALPELFPQAERVILGNFSRIGDFVKIGGRDYVVIMTRGHTWDFAVIEQILRSETAYLGVIGSRNKAAAARQRLLDAGYPEEKLDRIHSPVGLPIHAETPAEIAVSIAAEMIQARALLAKTET